MDDDELTALALAADPDAVVADDAVSLWDLWRADAGDALLPDWYMPAPMPGGRRQTGWRRRVAAVVIASFLAIAASGLCSTYGHIVLA
jgi:hypothetical protein